MKTTTIPQLPELDHTPIEAIGNILREKGKKEIVGILNWKDEYPYRPICNVFLGYTQEAVYLRYQVSGTSLKAVYEKDNSFVHEDSCVEFFCMPENTDSYTNFEFNCIGTCSAARRKGRDEDVRPFAPEQLQTILRHSSVGKRAFQEVQGNFNWEISLKIPFKLIGIDPLDRLKANFYKCADKTVSPHFVSWSEIGTETPDFHQPNYFGEIVFGK